MKLSLKKIGTDILKKDNLIYTFLRSAVSSQAASWVDMGLGFVLFSWAHLTPWLSTALGAIAGGAINCIVNYKFTFHAKNCPWSAVIVKYALVWVGSLLLNAFGTQFLYYVLNSWDWLKTLGFTDEGCYAAARLTTSLAVSWFWNFILQRYFVYHPTKFDKYATALVHLFVPSKD